MKWSCDLDDDDGELDNVVQKHAWVEKVPH